MILANGTIVAVADGHALALYRNKGTETELHLVTFEHPDVTPGNPGSGGRHRSSSSNPDKDRPGEDAFAAACAEQLNKLALSGALDALLVIADPRTLGEMRRHFHPTLQPRIVGELHKDLSGHSVEDITKAVQNA